MQRSSCVLEAYMRLNLAAAIAIAVAASAAAQSVKARIREDLAAKIATEC